MLLCLSTVIAGCTGQISPPRAGAPRSPAGPQSPGGTADRVALPPAAPAVLPGAARSQERNSADAAALREATARQALATVRAWGLDAPPIPAPEPPDTAPELRAVQGVTLRPGLPPVVARVPTDEKVVFLTVDDGAEKDPEFARMTRELDVPFTAFVSGYLARPDYGYFRGLAEQGDSIQNHTVNHRDLRKLTYEQQRQEICGQQDETEREIGTRPRLFRPPYGEYNEDTLKAAASCGIEAAALWNEEAFADHMEWRYADQRLHPGDIILTHFRGPSLWKGTMPDMLRQVLNTVTAQGYALGRLEDYL
ncbi:polysaccharide deacetylase family protein [Kitasatospora herbaricolor]|uniref:Polysaccharide deacetylase family protein n=1 Tax=Kitasatospora herbaricolor TaxID=68217 RepID=A0ABZ1WH00_9ACTN|nr:polysaccharide deacetylase family protein [Kitasatospora herbaricolor]